MTRVFDILPLSRATVGFDKLFQEFERQFPTGADDSPKYPPYNIVELNDDEWVISIAVAGFGLEDLNIQFNKNKLIVEGASPKQSDDVVYLHRGIAGRNFIRKFTLADHVEIVNANLSLGMLNIRLKRNVPEELQPRKIEITAEPAYTLIQD